MGLIKLVCAGSRPSGLFGGGENCARLIELVQSDCGATGQIVRQSYRIKKLKNRAALSFTRDNLDRAAAKTRFSSSSPKIE